ncbi:MAG: hypothetical protein NTX22_17940 [Ignavibacteriales bacterium]|nr:hypothetical protein [Ignavibacteriales bacterium]
MKNELKKLIGTIPSENDFRKKRMRFHQAWWRAFVLAEKEGQHPIRKEESVCNTILNGQTNTKNFLSSKITEAVRQTIQERQVANSGIIEEGRLFNNLLSSQPLCFNFFGELKIDTDFALPVLQQFWPELTKVNRVTFEFAPVKNYTHDNSAFDVAFEVMSDNQSGLIGLECKYTDTFSSTEYDKTEYRNIFNQRKEKVFAAGYEEFTTARFNQLFRNQLLAEALLQHGYYDFVYTGLFCHQDDSSGFRTGSEFQRMLKDGDKFFKIVTYQDFIEKIQQLEISWERRELSMLLWARYCGTQLSKHAFE